MMISRPRAAGLSLPLLLAWFAAAHAWTPQSGLKQGRVPTDSCQACKPSEEAEAISTAEEPASLLQSRTPAGYPRAKQRVCSNETISKAKVDVDVVVPPGAWCELLEVELSASVSSAGALFVSGCKVAGAVEAALEPHEGVLLVDTSVVGPVKVSGGAAGAGPLLVEKGQLSSVEAAGLEHVQLYDCKLDSLKVEAVQYGVGLEKTIVEEAVAVSLSTGAIDFLSVVVEGPVEVKGCSQCVLFTDSPSKFGQVFTVQDSSGRIDMIGTAMPKADLVVKGFRGSIWLDGVKLGAIDASGVTAGVTLRGVAAETGASFDGCGGPLGVEGCKIGELFMSTSEFTNATLQASSFNDAEVTIVGVAGPVVLEGNKDLDVRLEHNNYGLSLVGNDIFKALVSENLGDTTLTNNRIEELQCLGNAAGATLLTLSGNAVHQASGQCAATGAGLPAAQEALA